MLLQRSMNRFGMIKSHKIPFGQGENHFRSPKGPKLRFCMCRNGVCHGMSLANLASVSSVNIQKTIENGHL